MITKIIIGLLIALAIIYIGLFSSLLYHFSYIYWNIGKLTIGETMKVQRDINFNYNSMSKKQMFYFGWIYRLIFKRIDKHIQKLTEAM